MTVGMAEWVKEVLGKGIRRHLPRSCKEFLRRGRQAFDLGGWRVRFEFELRWRSQMPYNGRGGRSTCRWKTLVVLAEEIGSAWGTRLG